MSMPLPADVAQVIDIFARPEPPRADVRAGELVDRYLRSLEDYVARELPGPDVELDALLARLRPG